MPSRLQHENATNVVMEPHRLPALLQYRGARQLRIAAGDDPHRLAGRMHVRDVEAPSFHHIPFLPAIVTAASQMNPYAVRVTSSSASISLSRPACTYTPSRSEEHTSELQSLMSISYDVLCLTKQKIITHYTL